MKVYIVRATEYWQNYRGEYGSSHSIEKVYDSREKAVAHLENMRKALVGLELKDISDDRERVVALKRRTDCSPYMDIWISEFNID